MLYVALCTAWTLFSGPTHYVSLATAAFFGIGTYAVALGIDILPFPVLIAHRRRWSAALLAGLVGAATLRLSGVYFVIFTLGLAELIRQVVAWRRPSFGHDGPLRLHRFHREAHLYWMLLALTRWSSWRRLADQPLAPRASRMQIIGNDETVARHVGIDTAARRRSSCS